MLPTTKHEITFKDNHNVLSLDTFRIAGNVRFDYYEHFWYFHMKIIKMQIFLKLKNDFGSSFSDSCRFFTQKINCFIWEIY